VVVSWEAERRGRLRLVPDETVVDTAVLLSRRGNVDFRSILSFFPQSRVACPARTLAEGAPCSPFVTSRRLRAGTCGIVCKFFRSFLDLCAAGYAVWRNDDGSRARLGSRALSTTGSTCCATVAAGGAHLSMLRAWAPEEGPAARLGTPLDVLTTLGDATNDTVRTSMLRELTAKWATRRDVSEVGWHPRRVQHSSSFCVLYCGRAQWPCRRSSLHIALTPRMLATDCWHVRRVCRVPCWQRCHVCMGRGSVC